MSNLFTQSMDIKKMHSSSITNSNQRNMINESSTSNQVVGTRDICSTQSKHLPSRLCLLRLLTLYTDMTKLITDAAFNMPSTLEAFQLCTLKFICTVTYNTTVKTFQRSTSVSPTCFLLTCTFLLELLFSLTLVLTLLLTSNFVMIGSRLAIFLINPISINQYRKLAHSQISHTWKLPPLL